MTVAQPSEPGPPVRPDAASLRGGRGLPPALPRAPRWPIVLGIDPGTRAMGWGAIVVAPRAPRLLAAGTLRTDGRTSIASRLGELRVGVDELVRRLHPRTVVVERAFAARNVQSALRIGEARGVVLACCAAAGLEVVEIAPAAAKKALVGNGGAAKEQVARMVADALGLAEPPPGLDASDALALALAWLRRAGATGSLGSSSARPPGPPSAPGAEG